MKKRQILTSILVATGLILTTYLNTPIFADNNTSNGTQVEKEDKTTSEENSKETSETSTSETLSEHSSENSLIKEETGNTKVEIKEVVLYDEKDIKVTAKNLEFSETEKDLILNLLIENNSKEELNFSIDHYNVNLNHIGVSTYINETLSAGKKSKVKVNLHNEYDLIDLDKIAIIDFFLAVTKTDDSPYVESIPCEIKTNLFKENETYLPTPIYDNQLKIYSLGLTDNKYDAGIVLIFENNSDKNYTINFEEVYINGFSSSSTFVYLNSPKKSFNTVLARIDDKALEEADITTLDEIKEFEFKFSTLENNNYETRNVSDLIKINLNSDTSETEASK